MLRSWRTKEKPSLVISGRVFEPATRPPAWRRAIMPGEGRLSGSELSIGLSDELTM